MKQKTQNNTKPKTKHKKSTQNQYKQHFKKITKHNTKSTQINTQKKKTQHTNKNTHTTQNTKTHTQHETQKQTDPFETLSLHDLRNAPGAWEDFEVLIDHHHLPKASHWRHGKTGMSSQWIFKPFFSRVFCLFFLWRKVSSLFWLGVLSVSMAMKSSI